MPWQRPLLARNRIQSMTDKVSISPKLMRGTRLFMISYVGTWIVMALLLLIALFTVDEIAKGQVWSYWHLTLRKLATQAPAYVIALLPYLTILLIHDARRRYKSQKWAGVASSLLRFVAAPAALIWIILETGTAYRLSENYAYTWDTSVEHHGPQSRNRYKQDGKQRGIHVFNLPADSTDLAQLKTNNFEWITVVPYIGQELHNKPPIQAYASVSSDSNTVDPRNADSIRRYAQMAAQYDFHLVVKPHIWLSAAQGDAWRSDIAMQHEADWDLWFAYYTRHMLTYAALAEEIGADLFCIGTELHTAVMAKPERWRNLITQIRSVYSGELTYAANWSDELEKIPFWDMLDYIGIQAYFPVATVKSPSLAEMEAGWQPHVRRLTRLADHHKKPILFTEIGYRSTASAAVTPWEWTSARDFFRPISHKTQALAYEAFFNVVWPQPWFAGAHLWQWSGNSRTLGNNSNFTLAGKPALNVVARGFHPVMTPVPDAQSSDFGLLP